MNGVDMILPRDADDVGDVQVGGDGFPAGTDPIRLIGLEAVEGEAVLVGEDGDGANAHLSGGPQDADGDFAAVGDEEAADFFHGTAGEKRKNGGYSRAMDYFAMAAVNSPSGHGPKPFARGWEPRSAPAGSGNERLKYSFLINN